MVKRVGISTVRKAAPAERTSHLAPQTDTAERGVDRLLHLQQAIGNRATQSLLASGLLQPKRSIGPVNELPAPVSQLQRMCAECEEEEEEKSETLQRKPRSSGLSPIQAKLTVSEPGDKYEQEADRVALKVMRSPRTGDGSTESPTRVSSNSSSKRGNLDSNTKSFMESRFSTNFDQVRVHTGRRAAKAAVALDARAFTIGPDIYFGSGEYRPHDSSGRLLLAHELTHVVQQGYSNPMVQRQETGTSNDVTNQTSAIPTGDNIAPVVEEADRGTRKAIEVLEEALKAADGALAEKAFDEEKLARIQVQADKLRPMLEAYRKVDRGEPPDPGLTLDFDPERDQIDEGDADVLATGDFEDSGPAGAAPPQAFASRQAHGLVSLRVGGVDVQRAVCGGLCIAGAIALGALLLSGCSKKKAKGCTASATGISLGKSSSLNDGTKYGLTTPIIVRGTDLADVLDSELVGTSIDHTGSMATRPSATGSTSGFMAANSIPPDRHTSSIADHLSYFDTKGGDGSYSNLQMDLFKIPKCGIKTAQDMPNSGYRIKRNVKKEGTKVVGIITKTAEAVAIGSHKSTAGLTAKRETKVTLRP
ncbi:MAG: DUF4157 domain-containing protein [Phycisphaerales bacterium]